jgi:hypothetical protein
MVAELVEVFNANACFTAQVADLRLGLQEAGDHCPPLGEYAGGGFALFMPPLYAPIHLPAYSGLYRRSRYVDYAS